MAAATNFIVRVPATTSNLGPGFDALGLALKLYTDYTVRPLKQRTSRPSSLEGQAAGTPLRMEGCPLLPMLERVCAEVNAPVPPVAVTVAGEVPLGVGLGWSASARVAGAMAANLLLGGPLSREALLALLTEAEGHPDNVTPALYGGLTLTVRTANGPLMRVYQPAPCWRLALLVPDYTLSTNKARRALPKQVPLADAVFNLSRVPFVIDALVTGNADELAQVMEDRLHEPYRGEMIKRHGKIRRAAREAGAAATFISGAGPALAAFCVDEPTAKRVLKAMLDATEGAKFSAQGFILETTSEGAQVAEAD